MRALALVLVSALLACDEEPVAGTGSAVVHGVDDRVDVYAHPDPLLRAAARDSVVALVDEHRLSWNGSEYVIVGVGELGERQNLCPGQAFRDQVSLATCSGTLIDDDLVLTAGHCMVPQGPSGTADCTTTRFVFDFLETADGVLASIELEDVYRCRSVVAHALSDELDYAIVQLDRPVVGRVPAQVRRLGGPIPIGTPVAEIGFPSGLPMKIDDGGEVTDPGSARLDFFVTSLDAFHGNSGSGVLDVDRDVIGILVRTSEPDYGYDPELRCYRVVHAPVSRASLAVTYVDRALDALCDEAGYPSERLCDHPPTCGDSSCTAGETTSCPGDCPTPICGDGVCEAGDDRASCPYDCGATIHGSSAARGCAIGGRSSGATLALLAALLLLGRRRVSWAALLLCAGLLAPASASAQPRIHPWGLRFVGALEGHRDRAVLSDPGDRFGVLRTAGFGGGGRLGADVGLGRWAGVEASVGGRYVGGFGTAAIELALAPRFRILVRPRHELYLRLPLGYAWQVPRYGRISSGALLGGGVGYRLQLSRVVDVFFELGALVRLGDRVDPYYAYYEGYGLHPSSPPALRTASFGLSVGLGFGRGVREPGGGSP